MGMGSLTGALLMAGRSREDPGRRVLFASAFVVSIILAAVGLLHNLIPSIAAVAALGFFNIIFMNTANSTIQLHSDDQHRGRAMSVYTLAFAGTTPLGNFLTGAFTEKFGPGAGFIMCGAATGALMAAIALGYVKKLHGGRWTLHLRGNK
ncbi:MAG: MFS transporter [Bacillota bacterium]